MQGLREKRLIQTQRLTADPLIARAQLGDPNALSQLIETYRAQCTNFLFRYLHDVELARDAYQDVCVKVLQRMATYDVRYTFTTWLYAIAKNTAIDYLRRQGNAHFVVLDCLNEKVDSPNESPDVQFHHAQLTRAVDEALNSLPPAMREAFCCVRLRGMSHAATAQWCGVPLSTSKYRFFRARFLIRRYLRRNYPGLLPPNLRSQNGS